MKHENNVTFYFNNKSVGFVLDQININVVLTYWFTKCFPWKVKFVDEVLIILVITQLGYKALK